MIGLGLASSHAPAIFCPPDVWPSVYAAIPEYTKNSQPASAALETREVIEGYFKRVDAAFAKMRAELAAYKPDALIIVGDDDRHMFDEQYACRLRLHGKGSMGVDGSLLHEAVPRKITCDHSGSLRSCSHPASRSHQARLRSGS